MTVPDSGGDTLVGVIAAQVSQLLTEQGRQSAQLAVIDSTTKTIADVVSDHEKRIRENHDEILKLRTERSTGSDLWARVVAAAAVLAAGGSVWVAYVHH